MARDSSNGSDSQLDAIIARIHGLTSSVGGRSGNRKSEDSERGQAGDQGASAGERPAAASLSSLFKDRVPGPKPPPQPALDSAEFRQASHNQDSSTPLTVPVREQVSNGASDFYDSNQASDARSAEALQQLLKPNHRAGKNSNAAHIPSFEPSRDEPWRPAEPESLADVRVPESTIEQLILKFLAARGEVEGRQIADQIKLPFRLVEPILEWLKMEQSLAHKRGTATGDFAYVLTDKGRGQAHSYVAQCTYFGACPVPLQDYIASVKMQTVEGQKPKKNQLLHAFADLLINPHMLDRLGPAVNSGKGMFLYGFPGNGKTSIAERVTAAFGKWIWIPRAIDVDGDVLRLFDRMNHEADMPETSSGLLDHGGFDKRWIRIRRPTIVVGGELTMDMLEVQTNEQTNISEAPLQLKSNCGTLVIDDFGRQKISVDQLLNRWIVPLEKRFDFLNMRSGKKIQVPFDQLVVFSTNLEPKDLVDDAFLRRIPYKIEVENPSEADFRKLFEIMCRVLKIPYAPDPIDYLINKHYKPINRPFRNCQPRDLLLQVQNYCRYHDREIELRNEYFDYAVENYFSIM